MEGDAEVLVGLRFNAEMMIVSGISSEVRWR